MLNFGKVKKALIILFLVLNVFLFRIDFPIRSLYINMYNVYYDTGTRMIYEY